MNNPILFERMSLQGRFRHLIDTYGRDQALDIIRTAFEREIDRETHQTRLRDHHSDHA